MLRISLDLVPKRLCALRLVNLSGYDNPNKIQRLKRDFQEKKSSLGWWLKPSKFVERNDEILPPQPPHQKPEPAWVCHERLQMRFSAKKLYYVAIMIRGLTIDEALKQLTFCKIVGAPTIKEILLEAQEMAVREHNVEFKSNLWVAESNVIKGKCVKGLRRHARSRWGIIKYNYCNYFVRLEEGPPPEFFYGPNPTGRDKLETWLHERRCRKIAGSL